MFKSPRSQGSDTIAEIKKKSIISLGSNMVQNQPDQLARAERKGSFIKRLKLDDQVLMYLGEPLPYLENTCNDLLPTWDLSTRTDIKQQSIQARDSSTIN